MNTSRLSRFDSFMRGLNTMLLGVLGWVSIQYLSSINQNFKNIEGKFEKFFEMAVKMDKRVDRLEYKVFDNKDLRNKIYKTTTSSE